MDKEKNSAKDIGLDFNIYYIFTKEKQNIENKIALAFKDYLESLKLKDK